MGPEYPVPKRLGGILTFTGLLADGGETLLVVRICDDSRRHLARYCGGLLSFTGSKRAIPGARLKGREMLGGLVYSVGLLIVLTLVITWNPFDGFHALPIEGQLAT